MLQQYSLMALQCRCKLNQDVLKLVCLHAGTWLYGRGGWCDGQQVFPWVLDITTWLRQPGHHNSLTYSATFNGGLEPCQHDQPGYIMMQSSLVLYIAPADALSRKSVSTQESTLNAAV